MYKTRDGAARSWLWFYIVTFVCSGDYSCLGLGCGGLCTDNLHVHSCFELFPMRNDT